LIGFVLWRGGKALLIQRAARRFFVEDIVRERDARSKTQTHGGDPLMPGYEMW